MKRREKAQSAPVHNHRRPSEWKKEGRTGSSKISQQSRSRRYTQQPMGEPRSTNQRLHPRLSTNNPSPISFPKTQQRKRKKRTHSRLRPNPLPLFAPLLTTPNPPNPTPIPPPSKNPSSSESSLSESLPGSPANSVHGTIFSGPFPFIWCAC